MKIREILQAIYRTVFEARRMGTSTMLKKLASENDVYILVPNGKCKEMFGDSAITFGELIKNGGLGRSPKPLLLDNFTLLELTRETFDEIARLEGEVVRRDQLIHTISRAISNFEKGNNTKLWNQF